MGRRKVAPRQPAEKGLSVPGLLLFPIVATAFSRGTYERNLHVMD